MLRQCSAVTCLLLVLSIISKLTVDTGDLRHVNVVKQLIEKALYWYDVALNDTEPLNVYHHFVMCLATLHSTREVMSDPEVMRTTGVNISTFIRRVEKKIHTVRQNELERAQRHERTKQKNKT